MNADLNLRDAKPPQVTFTLTKPTADSQPVELHATDDTGLRAVVFYDRTAGTVSSGKKLTGRSQTITERVPLRSTKSRDAEIDAIITDNGGHQTRKSLTAD